MRILLTGATGFVGSSFLSSLNSEDTVVCLGRTETVSTSATFYKVDIADAGSVEKASRLIDGTFDALVHMAAFVPKVSDQDVLSSTEAVNVGGLINVLESFSGRFQKIILGSTVEVYDQSKINSVINEDSPVGPGSYYATSKLASEFIAMTYAKKNKLQCSILRFSVMYGPSDPISRALPNFIKSAISGNNITISGGAALRDYIHIDEVIKSIHCALITSNSGIYNIGTGVGVSIIDAARLIIKESNSSSNIIELDGDQSADIVVDPTKAKNDLQFEAKIVFPQKIKDMIDSYK